MLVLACATAQATDAPKFDPKRLSQDVKTVSADEFEGRAPNSAGEIKTVDFLTYLPETAARRTVR